MIEFEFINGKSKKYDNIKDVLFSGVQNILKKELKNIINEFLIENNITENYILNIKIDKDFQIIITSKDMPEDIVKLLNSIFE